MGKEPRALEHEIKGELLRARGWLHSVWFLVVALVVLATLVFIGFQVQRIVTHVTTPAPAPSAERVEQLADHLEAAHVRQQAALADLADAHRIATEAAQPATGPAPQTDDATFQAAMDAVRQDIAKEQAATAADRERTKEFLAKLKGEAQ